MSWANMVAIVLWRPYHASMTLVLTSMLNDHCHAAHPLKRSFTTVTLGTLFQFVANIAGCSECHRGPPLWSSASPVEQEADDACQTFEVSSGFHNRNNKQSIKNGHWKPESISFMTLSNMTLHHGIWAPQFEPDFQISQNSGIAKRPWDS